MHHAVSKVSAAIPLLVGATDGDVEDPLIEAAGSLEGAHVLLLGAGADLLCTMIRLGCLEATMLRGAERPAAAAHDLVLAPLVTLDRVDEVVGQARRALVPTGRFVARVAPGRAAVALARALRLNGFVVEPGRALVAAELAGFAAGFRA